MLDPLVVPPSATGAGTWAAAVNALALHNGIFDNGAAADLDNVSFTLYLPKGVYTLYGNFIKGTNCGLLDISLDGVKIVSLTDLYAAAASYTYILTDTAIAVSNSGLHTLLIAVNGKNAASSDYKIGFTSLSFVRTA